MRVLLVEDKSSDREVLRNELERRGAQVITAATDTDAYAALRSAEFRHTDLMLADINLGAGTTGFDVARAARAVRPDLRVIYMTGYSIETGAHEVDGGVTLKKPMRLSQLVDDVLRLADGPRGGANDDGGARSSSAAG